MSGGMDEAVKEMRQAAYEEKLKKESTTRLSDGIGGPIMSAYTAQEKAKSALDKQEGGNHYKHFPIQPIEFINKNNLRFNIGNVIKYAVRAEHKNGLEDLRKAKHYLELEAELRYGEKL
jgi:hypothetical protein